MGYNSNCVYQNCNYNCCDFSGYCPTFSSNCYYYYREQNNAGTIAGAVVGSVLGLILIILLIRHCYNKKQEEKRIQEIRRQNLNNPHNTTQGTTIIIPGYGQGQQMNQMYGQPLNNNPMNVSPVYGQPINPVYGQPMNPPHGQQMNPPYYGQPSFGQPVNYPVIVN